LRQVDVKAEHFERQVARIEAERDSWEKKCEEAQEKYNQSKRELEEVHYFSHSIYLVTLTNIVVVDLLQVVQQMESI